MVRSFIRAFSLHRTGKTMSRKPLLADKRRRDPYKAIELSTTVSKDDLPPNVFKVPKFYVVLFGCSVAALVSGFQLTTGYLISPVERACPNWSSSITVVGGALLWATSAVTGIVVVPHLTHQLQEVAVWLAACVASFGIGFGLLGIAVTMCELSTSFSETIYMLGYVFLGFGCILPTPVVSMILIRWLPKYKGFSSGYSSLCVGVGSLGISQLMLYCQTLVKKDDVHVTTVLFGIGVITVLLLSIGMVTIGAPPWDGGRNHHVSKLTFGMSRLEILRTRQFAVIFFVRIVGPFCGFGLTARQQDFLDTIWRTKHSPIATLGAAVFGSYIIGRVFWLFMSEKKTNLWCWTVSLSVQSVAIGFLPWLVYHSDSSWSKYAALIDFCIITATFPGSKMTAFGTCLEVFGSVNITTSYGMSVFPLGLAGFLAPLTFEICKTLFSTYTPILYITAVASFLAMVACLRLSPIDNEDRCT